MILPLLESGSSDDSDTDLSEDSLFGDDMPNRSDASNRLCRSAKHSSAKPPLTRVIKFAFYSKRISVKIIPLVM